MLLFAVPNMPIRAVSSSSTAFIGYAIIVVQNIDICILYSANKPTPILCYAWVCWFIMYLRNQEKICFTHYLNSFLAVSCTMVRKGTALWRSFFVLKW